LNHEIVKTSIGAEFVDNKLLFAKDLALVVHQIINASSINLHDVLVLKCHTTNINLDLKFAIIILFENFQAAFVFSLIKCMPSISVVSRSNDL
jgi:hypothetical protein